MKLRNVLLVAAAGSALVAGLVSVRVRAQGDEVPKGTPAATINLATKEGVDQVKGSWRYSDIKIMEVEAAGKKTYNYTPHAREAAKPGFNDSGWEELDPTTLGKPRAGGQLCFNWYRINVTIPEKIGDFDTTGSTVVFDTIVDDYGEVWVNGNLPRKLGQQGGSIVAGFNAPNRLIVGKNVKSGDKITIAVFGINSPISATPGNFIFLRYAKLDFYKP
jgi:gluconolactonase